MASEQGTAVTPVVLQLLFPAAHDATPGDHGRRSWRVVSLVTVVAVIAITLLLDESTGTRYSALPFYALAVLWATWQLGFLGGLLVAAAVSAGWMFINAPVGDAAAVWNAAARFFALGLLSYLLAVHRLLSHTLRETRRLAQLDSLTGALNTRAFGGAAQREVERCRRQGAPLSVAFLDLDRFKPVNDLQGHAAGDAVLAAVSKALQHELRRTDLLARMGGDEFVVLLPFTGVAEAVNVGKRLRSAVADAASHHNADVTASIGMVTWCVPPAHPEVIVRKGDSLMYMAKRAGGDRVCHEAVGFAEQPLETSPGANSQED